MLALQVLRHSGVQTAEVRRWLPAVELLAPLAPQCLIRETTSELLGPSLVNSLRYSPQSQRVRLSSLLPLRRRPPSHHHRALPHQHQEEQSDQVPSQATRRPFQESTPWVVASSRELKVVTQHSRYFVARVRLAALGRDRHTVERNTKNQAGFGTRSRSTHCSAQSRSAPSRNPWGDRCARQRCEALHPARVHKGWKLRSSRYVPERGRSCSSDSSDRCGTVAVHESPCPCLAGRQSHFAEKYSMCRRAGASN